MGYPSFQKPDTKILELDDIGGKCRPAAGRDGILRMVTTRHYASAKEDDWKGVSGAGLFVEDVLAGVVIEAKPNGLDARTLEDIRRKESPIWGLIKPYMVDHMQEGQFGGLLQLNVNARAHDLELWLGEPSYQKAIWGWLFSLDEAGLGTYTRKQVEERFSASPLTRVLNTISHLVDELKLSYDEKEARDRARSLLFNLLPLHSDLSLENDDIGSDVKDALRIRGQLDLCRTPKKILARRELHLPRGIGSATISALDQSPGLVKAFVGVVQEQMKWDEQTALEAIEGDTLRYIDEVEVQIARKKNTDEIERPFFITLSQAEENSDLVLETLRTELNIGVYIKGGQSPRGVRAALGRALVTLGATQSDALSPSRENKDSAT